MINAKDVSFGTEVEPKVGIEVPLEAGLKKWYGRTAAYLSMQRTLGSETLHACAIGLVKPVWADVVLAKLANVTARDLSIVTGEYNKAALHAQTRRTGRHGWKLHI